MNEPDWCNMGYSANGYEAQCNSCETVARLDFGDEEKKLLTIISQDGIGNKQDELFQIVSFFTLEKLRRNCSCENRNL